MATFALDDVTGIPTGMVNDVQVPSPTALVPAPAPAGWRFQWGGRQEALKPSGTADAIR